MEDVEPEVLELFGVDPGAGGLVPHSMYIAIPTHEDGVWMGHNLASVAEKVPGQPFGGLGSLTKAVALAAYRTRRQLGVTQWSSRALFVHTRLGPLALDTAWTPAHSDASTLTYRATITESSLLNLARDPNGKVEEPEPTMHVTNDDHDAQRELQERIERGEKWCITGRPERLEDGRQRTPVGPIEG